MTAVARQSCGLLRQSHLFNKRTSCYIKYRSTSRSVFSLIWWQYFSLKSEMTHTQCIQTPGYHSLRITGSGLAQVKFKQVSLNYYALCHCVLSAQCAVHTRQSLTFGSIKLKAFIFILTVIDRVIHFIKKIMLYQKCSCFVFTVCQLNLVRSAMLTTSAFSPRCA